MQTELDRFKEKNFLRHAKVRDLTLWDIAGMTENECFWRLVEFRWGARDKVVCPGCGSINLPFARLDRKQLRCRDCDHHFSPVVDSPFLNRRLDYKKLLMAFSFYVSGSKGVPCLHMARLLDMQHKTALALTGKIRESLVRNQDQEILSGVIEIDGGHFCGKPRKGNYRVKLKPEDRAAAIIAKFRNEPPPNKLPRSKAERKNWARRKKFRRIVMVLRQIHPEKGARAGAVRTRVAIAMAENEKVATELARKLIQPGAVIMTDENAAYNALAAWYEHHTVEHAKMFSGPDGENENQAECYFSRLRRGEYGTFHGFRTKYLVDYAQEFAWREDVRRHTELEKLEDLISRIFKNGKSVWWRGYWQGHHREGEYGLMQG